MAAVTGAAGAWRHPLPRPGALWWLPLFPVCWLPTKCCPSSPLPSGRGRATPGLCSLLASSSSPAPNRLCLVSQALILAPTPGSVAGNLPTTPRHLQTFWYSFLLHPISIFLDFYSVQYLPYSSSSSISLALTPSQPLISFSSYLSQWLKLVSLPARLLNPASVLSRRLLSRGDCDDRRGGFLVFWTLAIDADWIVQLLLVPLAALVR